MGDGRKRESKKRLHKPKVGKEIRREVRKEKRMEKRGERKKGGISRRGRNVDRQLRNN